MTAHKELENYAYLDNIKLNSILIGKRIKDARTGKDFTQEELADICQCTPTHISNLENGKVGVSLELLYKFSIVLEKRIDYFVMDDINANPEILIELAIAPKLQECDPQMLEMVDNFLDRMITYRDNMIGKQQSKLEIK